MKKLFLLSALLCAIGAIGQTENGHEYVDLGLPSGTMWATCNLGATTPDGVGGTYAWGESADYGDYDTTNKKQYSIYFNYTKCQYGWHTYKYAPLSDDPKYENRYVTKYCNNKTYWAGEGEPDMKYLLEPDDDAATIHWGGHWQTPSKAQMQELQNYTNEEWKTKNGTAGVELTSIKNGKSIFLPATGMRTFYAKDDNSDSRNGQNSTGYYWTNLRTSTAYKAAFMQIFQSKDGVSIQNLEDTRWKGFAVRPVFAQAPVITDMNITLTPGYESITVEWAPVTTQENLTYEVYVSGSSLQLIRVAKNRQKSNKETITNTGEPTLKCTVEKFFYDNMMFDIVPNTEFYVTIVVYNETTKRSSTYSTKAVTTLEEDPDAISSTASNTALDPAFDLNGNLVGKNYKGIVIKGGKKYKD